MIDYKKINELMCFESFDDETPEQVFIRCSNRDKDLPSREIIDIVYSGGLQKWADNLEVESEKDVYNMVLKSLRRTISEPVFQDNRSLKTFPPFANFFYYCQKIDRSGKMHDECTAISKIAWNGVIARRNIDERTFKMFLSPNNEIYKKSVEQIKKVYGYSDKEIDGLRYFVCQTRHNDHNPSLNKSIYHWGDDKQTGKTTVAATIVCILNGDVLKNRGVYESHIPTELQFGDFDIPKAALYNAVLLDEAAPKDSRKSYNQVKSKLTSSSCNYNPKYKSPISIPCRRNYYFTSNDPISEFVQDAKERRFIEIHSIEKPQQMSFDAIYKLWFDFCTNCTPESNWQTWYNSFDLVNGLASMDLDEVKNEILLKHNEIFSPLVGTYTTAKQVANKIYKNEPTREQKKTVSIAMKLMFANAICVSNKSNFSVQDCRIKCSQLTESDESEEVTIEMPF